ncbi:MAG: hypothetical protein LBS61_00590 [Endomicrobium sp.]|jgi:hypothetical protein|nr:hypothetical protein [Endomicrobium sp.]
MSTLPKFNNKDFNSPFTFLENSSNLSPSSEDGIFQQETKHFPKDKIERIVILEGSSKSENFHDLKFMNFISSNTCKEYKVLKNVYESWKKSIDIINDFESIEIENRNQEKIRRLCTIIAKHRKKKCYLTECKHKCLERNILKTIEHKYIKDRNIALRIFAKKVRDIIYVCLIDSFHLACPAPNRKISKKNTELLYYDKICKNKYCISNICQNKDQQ